MKGRNGTPRYVIEHARSGCVTSVCSARRAFLLGVNRLDSTQARLRWPWRCILESRVLEGTAMPDDKPVVHSDPEIMSGTPVFVGTRVPFQTLLDYLEAGQPLSEFLEDFPTVSKEQAIAALEQAKEALLARAHPA